MNRLLLIGLLLAPLQAQVAEPTASPPPPATSATAPAVRNAADLDTLLGPIALYPDALIGLILPASTTPADIVLAARSLGSANATEAAAAQPWDDSVKALTHYPDLLRWLDQNLTWTQALGEAFVAQPADVMNAVQRLRQKARAAGTLVDTPQQQVVVQDEALLIVPAQRETIYVPVYDPAVVYVSHPTRISYQHVYFHSGYRTGPWLCYNPNWHHGSVHVIHHHHYHRSPHHIHYYSHPPASSHVWSPRPILPRHPAHVHGHPPHIHGHPPAHVNRQPAVVNRPGHNPPSRTTTSPFRQPPAQSADSVPAGTHYRQNPLPKQPGTTQDARPRSRQPDADRPSRGGSDGNTSVFREMDTSNPRKK